MSVSVANIQARYAATRGTDPIFAAVDGATCPKNVSAPGQPASAFSLLLNQGVFRIFLPLPADAEFTLGVLRDPYGCNTDPIYATDPATGAQIVSVYRRPAMAGNLGFVDRTIAPTGSQVPLPAIMWDEREASLEQQAIDATLTHAQALTAPTASEIGQIVGFELGIYTAQQRDSIALGLTTGGASGGPVVLSSLAAPTDTPGASITSFQAWSGLSGGASADQRAAIARGEVLFNTRQFTAERVAGFGTVAGVTCSTCHREAGSANNPFGQSVAVDIGIGGIDRSFGQLPDITLPLFQVTCAPGKSTEFNGSQVVTNDPGRALITGKCADIEKVKVPQLRALASRPPYFSNGQVSTLLGVVEFYNQRFAMHMTVQERQDLASFLSAL